MLKLNLTIGKLFNTLILTLLINFTASSQNGPINFETPGFGASWTWTVFENFPTNPSLTITANPSPTGINQSSTVAKFNALVTGNPWAGCETTHGAGIGTFTLTPSNCIVKMMVYKPVISDVGIKFATLGNASTGEIKVANTLINQWEELTFNFTAVLNAPSSSGIDQIIIFPDFKMNPSRTSSNICYFDNITFSSSTLSNPTPSVAAPTPTAAQANVISLFSNTYTNVGVDTWLTNWSAGNTSTLQIAGNDTRLYSNLNFVGIETTGANMINANCMTHFNIDIYTPNMTQFRVKLVDWGANGIYQGTPNDDTEAELTYTPTLNGWNTYNIPLSNFASGGLVNKAHIAQIILSGNPVGNGILYVDNIYFNKSNLQSNNVSICNGQSYTINPIGMTSFTVQGVSGSAIVSPTINTTYTVTGTNSLTGCSSNGIISLSVNPNPIITVNNGTICAGQNFTINPNGANTYTIQGANAVVNPSVNSTYTVIGTNTITGCRSQVFATSSLTVNPNPTLSISGASGICTGQNASLTANGATNYTWSSGSNSVSIITTPTANTTYTLTGSTPQGCSSSTTQLVTVQLFLSVSIVGPTSVCFGQAANLSGLGGVTYTWNTGATTATVVPTLTTTTTFSVIGASGTCSNTAIKTISVTPNPTVTVNNGTICAGQNFTINPNGANTYTIQGGIAVVSPSINSTYTVIGTNTTTGCSSINTSSLTVNPNPIITVNNGTICAGQNFTINPNGANSYTIQGGIAVVSPSINTTYSVVGTSTAGCVSQAVATSSLIVNPNPIITVNNGTICAGQSFTINPNGANTFTIQGGIAVVSPSINTTYSVVGTSTAGCVSQAFATSSLTVNANPIITIAGTQTICSGESANITASGANTYTWSNAANTNSISVSPSVTTQYSVAGTNTLGCSNSLTLSIDVQLCTNLNNTNQEFSTINLFPNPNNGQFTINISDEENTQINITNVLGQIILSQKGESITKIDLSKFENGMYFIKVINTNNKTIFNKGIIKQ